MSGLDDAQRERDEARAMFAKVDARAERYGAIFEGLGLTCRNDTARAADAKLWTLAIPGLTRGDGNSEREAAEALQANLRALAAEPHELRAEVVGLRAEVERLKASEAALGSHAILAARSRRLAAAERDAAYAEVERLKGES